MNLLRQKVVCVRKKIIQKTNFRSLIPLVNSCIIGGSRGVLRMLQPNARWRILEQETTKVTNLVNELNLSQVAARLLVNRGFTDPETASEFLMKDEPAFLDPFLLKGMAEAVDRIQSAVEKNEQILVFGDYDADGVSSTAVLVTALKMIGADCDYYIPNRFTEGYGPNNPALQWAKDEGYSLVITVDTGISAVTQADYAKEIGLDFIVTDHHEPPPTLPNSYTTINPKQPGCSYPFKELAGVGVAFKVAHGLLGRVPNELLDYAVIGTIADLVPLVGENRLLAKKGLRAFQTSDKIGIQALKDVCGMTAGEVEADHIGFAIGPRLNAAGRLDSAIPAVELLLAENREEANELASEIDRLNKERQKVVNDISKDAIAVVQEMDGIPEALVVAKEGWNAGVIGIVASRLVEKFYRPTIVLTIDPETGLAKGSARSIEGFDMFAELSKSRDILPHFGGHPMAAGMTLQSEHVGMLRERLIEQAKNGLAPEAFTPITTIDLTVAVDDVTIEVLKEIEELSPFGVENAKPRVLIDDVKLADIKQIGSDSSHLKFQFAGEAKTLDGIAFRKGDLFEHITPQASVSAVGTLSINEWNGRIKPQLIVDDLAVKQWQLFDWRSLQLNRVGTRLVDLPSEKSIVIAFQEKTFEACQERGIVVYRSSDPLPSFANNYIILLDVPSHREELYRLFEEGSPPSRIYVVFSEEEESFFKTNPNRDQFKWYYAFLKKRQSFKVADLKKLEAYKGWSSETTSFMNEVFNDLGFIQMDDQYLTIVEAPAKKDLSDSKTYQAKQEQTWLENELVYASYGQLRELFSERIGSKDSQKKETITHGL